MLGSIDKMCLLHDFFLFSSYVNSNIGNHATHFWDKRICGQMRTFPCYKISTMSGRVLLTRVVPLGESAILSLVGNSRIPLTRRSDVTSFIIWSTMYAPIEWPMRGNQNVSYRARPMSMPCIYLCVSTFRAISNEFDFWELISEYEFRIPIYEFEFGISTMEYQFLVQILV